MWHFLTMLYKQSNVNITLLHFFTIVHTWDASDFPGLDVTTWKQIGLCVASYTSATLLQNIDNLLKTPVSTVLSILRLFCFCVRHEARHCLYLTLKTVLILCMHWRGKRIWKKNENNLNTYIILYITTFIYCLKFIFLASTAMSFVKENNKKSILNYFILWFTYIYFINAVPNVALASLVTD